MGLAVTYGIVQEHKGSIEVSSRQGGTRFHLRLPWSDRARQSALWGRLPSRTIGLAAPDAAEMSRLKFRTASTPIR
jgi:hypothetical protein